MFEQNAPISSPSHKAISSIVDKINHGEKCELVFYSGYIFKMATICLSKNRKPPLNPNNIKNMKATSQWNPEI